MTECTSCVQRGVLIRKLMEQVRFAFFPEYYGEGAGEGLSSLAFALLGEEQARKFLDRLPEINAKVRGDVEAIAANDPAAVDREEIVVSYPGVHVMLHYRVAHQLLEQGVKVIPRIISEMAHGQTGVDIHPAARIGEHFAIDHGTGIVIGETAVIGDHVMLYQGVTLGAKHFRYDPEGRPMNIPRHPILEDNVTVYSNTSILGRVRIGHDTVIGGNVWLTHDVPPFSKVLQTRAVTTQVFDGGEGI